MSIHFKRWGIALVWPHGADVPNWAWKLAHYPRFRIGCWGQYENSLEFSFGRF
jgi:hypothetical protein